VLIKSRETLPKSNREAYGHTVKIKGTVRNLQKGMITASSKDLSFVDRKRKKRQTELVLQQIQKTNLIFRTKLLQGNI